MANHIFFESKALYYNEKGKGKTVVLLHGYLESMKIWDEFQLELSRNYHTIAIDIIGHGLSEKPTQASVEYIAEQTLAVINHLGVQTCSIIGHSMGGYGALAFAEKYETRLDSLILLNSHPFEESENRKKSRKREADLVKLGRKNLIVNASISRSFTKENAASLRSVLDQCLAIAQKTSDEAALCAIEAIVNKPDRQHVLKNLKRPILILHGKQDENLDQYSSEHIECNAQTKFIELENCAHMGMFEQRDNCLTHIQHFIGLPSNN